MKVLFFFLINFKFIFALYHPLELSNISRVPSSAPPTIAQSFESTHYTHIRNVTLYWQNIPNLSKYTTENFFYFISATNLETLQTYYKSTKLATIDFEFLDQYPYVFQIFSRNNFGLSQNYSEIYLPPADDLLATPRIINVFVRSNQYEVEWEVDFSSLTNFRNFTVFWCEVAKYYMDPCTGELNWTYVSDTKFYLPHSSKYYKFAISVNTDTSTSGITWAKCIVQLPISELYHLMALTQTSNSVLIKWQFYCEAQGRVVQNYLIEFCPRDDCFDMNSTFFETTTNQFLLENLTPNTTYKIIFSSPEVREKYEIFGTTDLGVPENPTELAVNFSQDHWIFSWNSADEYLAYFKVEIVDPATPNWVLFRDQIQNSKSYHLNQKLIQKRLKPYTSYLFNITSCNAKSTCSFPAISTQFHTLPEVPGKPLNPPVEKLNETTYRVYFQPPQPANGPINYYHITQESTTFGRSNFTFPGSAKHSDIEISCPTTPLTLKISIAAGNFVPETARELIGDYSDPTSIDLCALTLRLSNNNSKIFTILAIIISVIILITIIIFTARFISKLRTKKEKLVINVKCNDNSEPNIKNFEIFHQEEIQFENVMNQNLGIFTPIYYNVNFDIAKNTKYLESAEGEKVEQKNEEGNSDKFQYVQSHIPQVDKFQYVT